MVLHAVPREVEQSRTQTMPGACTPSRIDFLLRQANVLTDSTHQNESCVNSKSPSWPIPPTPPPAIPIPPPILRPSEFAATQLVRSVGCADPAGPLWCWSGACDCAGLWEVKVGGSSNHEGMGGQSGLLRSASRESANAEKSMGEGW